MFFIDDFYESKNKAIRLEAELNQLIGNIEKQLKYKQLMKNRKIGLEIFKKSVKEKFDEIKQANKNLDKYMLNKLFGEFTYIIIWIEQKEKFEKTLKTLNETECYIKQT